MPALSPLERLQLDVEQCLLSLPQISTVAVTSVRPRSAGAIAQFQTKLNNFLAGMEVRNGKKGTSVIVGMPVLDDVNPNMYGLKGRLLIELSVIENIMINEGADGTGLTAESLAYLLAQMLPQLNFAPFGQLLAEKQLITPRPESVMEKRVEYRVRLSVLNHANPYAKCAPPRITLSGSTITLTGDDDLWYTSDESFPGPGNGTAVLYTGPFEKTASSYRAAAHAADKMCSDVVAAVF